MTGAARPWAGWKGPAVVAGVCGGAFGVLALAVVRGQTLARLDVLISTGLDPLRGAALTRAMEVITLLGNYQSFIALVALAAAPLIRVRWWRGLIALLGGMIGGDVLNNLVKVALQRPRPPALVAALDFGGFSFPSAHAMMSLVFWGTLAGLLTRLTRWGSAARWGWTFAPLVLMVGFSRVYLNAHWFTDVVGGYLAGGAVLGVTLAFLSAQRGEEGPGVPAGDLRG